MTSERRGQTLTRGTHHRGVDQGGKPGEVLSEGPKIWNKTKRQQQQH